MATQGQSIATTPKQLSLSSFLGIHLNIAANVYAKGWCKQYVYIETNAGSGYNEQANCEGSPIIALSKLTRKLEMPWLCVFVEKDPLSCINLAGLISGMYGQGISTTVVFPERSKDLLDWAEKKLASYPLARVRSSHPDRLNLFVNALFLGSSLRQCIILNFDNSIAVASVNRLPASSIGLVYADPNALKDSPEEALRTFFQSKTTRKIDLLFNLDGHIRRRVVACQDKGHISSSYNDITGLMRRIPKDNWWIRDPVSGNSAGSKWVFLFASNYADIKIKNLKDSGLVMHKTESARGRQIIGQIMGSGVIEEGGQLALPL